MTMPAVQPRTFAADLARTVPYMRHVKSLLGQVLLRDATDFEDRKEATDLKVLAVVGDRTRIGVRLRSEKYAERYPDDLTFRCSRPRSGNETEWAKVLHGWMDLFLYGFMHPGAERLLGWTVLDMHAFRAWVARQRAVDPRWTPTCKPNADDSSEFYVINRHDLEKQSPTILLLHRRPTL